MEFLKKIDEWIGDRVETQMNNKELRDWDKLIKKACKKYYIKNKDFLNMYLSIQKKILAEVNSKELEGKVKNNKSKFPLLQSTVKQRVYDLNREFILLVNGEYHNSLHALARQMIELYIRMLHCRQDSSVINKLIDEKKQKVTPFHVIEGLKKKIKFPYMSKIDDDKFLDSAYSWFCYFSNIFHISGVSFSQNMWVFNKEDNRTRLYVEKPELKEGEAIMIFTKKAVVTDWQYRTLIHQFYTFSSLTLRELELIMERENGK